MAGIYHLKNFGISSVVEWGCGLGYYADWIHRDTGIVCKSLDVAPAAIEKAKPLFPHLDFEVAGIGADFEKYTDYDCILFAEIVWYILPQLRQIVQQLQTHCRGKYLLVNQVFYKGTQKYGTEYFTNVDEFIAYMQLTPVAQCQATTVNDSTIETSVLFKI